MRTCPRCGQMVERLSSNGRCSDCNAEDSKARYRAKTAEDWSAALAHAARLGINIDPEGYTDRQRSEIARTWRLLFGPSQELSGPILPAS